MPVSTSRILENFIKRRYLYIVFFVILIFSASYLIELYFVRTITNNWEEISKEKTDELSLRIQHEFFQYQQDVVKTANSITKDNVIIDAIELQNKKVLFEKLKDYYPLELSIEIYDQQTNLLAWSNNFGSNISIDRFPLFPDSYVEQGLIYTWYIYIHPIYIEKQLIGFIVIKKLFEVSYPLSNRFISSELFEDIFSKRLDINIEFDFSKNAVIASDTTEISVPIKNINDKIIGFASYQIPTKSASVDEIENNFSLIRNFLIAFLSIVIFYPVIIFTYEKVKPVYRAIIIVLFLWIVRYVWLWIDFPSELIRLDIFNPNLFASSFGFGIAKSIGELFITSIFLFINITIIFKDSINNITPKVIQKNISLNLIITLICSILFIFLLRGYFAIIISAVFDSVLKYIDPSSILPSVELFIMYVNLLLITLSFVFLAVLFILVSFKWFSFFKNYYNNWILLFVIYSLISIVYGFIHPNPLSSNIARVLILVGLFITGGILYHYIFRRKILKFNFILIVFSIAAIILVAFSLYFKSQENYRSKLQLYATEVGRPIDSWITFVVDEALNQIATQRTTEIIKSENDVRDLAFSEWAKTILSREGYNCAVTIFNERSEIVGDFRIGSTLSHYPERGKFEISTNRTVTLREEMGPFGTIKNYIGYAPLIASDSLLVGGVRIEVAAAKGEIFQKEQPVILKTYAREDFSSYYRDIYYSEFINGYRVFTTNKELSNNYIVPDTVTNVFENTEKSITLLKEKIDGNNYESVFVKSPDNKNNWIALNAEMIGIEFCAVNILKLGLIFLFIGAIIYLFSIIIYKEKIKYDFRLKLLTAFLLVTIIPIALISYFNRQYAIDRTIELTRNTLEEETVIINSYLKNFLNSNNQGIFLINNSICRDISMRSGIDFSLFVNSELTATSKPEIYDASMLHRRMSPEAYFNLSILGKQFFVENQSIGTFNYLVGYSVVIDNSGKLIGVISIPSLYKHSSIEEEMRQRNAYIVGAYSLIIILALIIALIFANQISKPARELTEATRRIAEGDLEYRIDIKKKDEFGQLENAFNEMTQEIKQKREELVRFEKELAWKEMAKQVAHEIKNPLTPIRLAIQHIHRAYKDGSAEFDKILKQSVDMISEQIDTLNRIASEFSSFAKMPSRNLTVCNVNDIISEAVRLFAQYQDVKFEINFQQSKLLVNADEEELRRAFVNLIRNSVQAMNEKGTLTITTETKNENVEIRIADTGYGIPEEISHKIFEPNFSTKTEGMGLGLAIVKKTIDDLKGTIGFISKKDSGTVFIVNIPLVKIDE